MATRSYSSFSIFGLLCSIVIYSGCAVKAPIQVAPVPTAVASVDRLRADLERIFQDQNSASAQWGVEIVSLDRGELFYERNASRLYMPASNNKLLTSVSALVRLGPDYRYETGVWMRGTIDETVLKGDLLIVGSGDPSTAARFHSGDPFAVFKEWAARLKEKGVLKIEGDLIGDDRSLENPLGSGWQWDELAYGYAAPVTALQFNENLVTAEVTPADREGSLATVKVSPLQDCIAVDCRVLTGPVGSQESLEAERGEMGESVVLRGSVPFKGGAVNQRIAVRYPTLFYLRALKETLQTEGIDVSKCGLKIAPRDDSLPSNRVLLWNQSSIPLADILKPLLKVSQNLYAETMTRTLGAVVGGEGSFRRGREVVEETLGMMAVEKGTYLYADGSGLSRHNLISADLLVRIFKYMYRHKYFSQFYDSLPVGGVDGTIGGRMKGTKAEGNVHAKTGTLAQVRSLSGYMKTADGEMLAFAMICNNFLASNKAVEYVQDSALERLAAFTRQ